MQSKKYLFFFSLLIITIMTCRVCPASEEKWKGTPYTNNFAAGILTGMGVLDGSIGFSLLATGSFKIFHKGFIPDINDQAHLELQMGPLFMQGGTGLTYSFHLRWDFHKNYLWTFYALGGLAGVYSGYDLNRLRRIFLRTGLGVMWNHFEKLSFRAEFSHEFIGVGATYSL